MLALLIAVAAGLYFFILSGEHRSALARGEAQRAELEARTQALTDELEQLRAGRQQLQDQVARLRDDKAALQGERDSLRREKDELTRRLAEAAIQPAEEPITPEQASKLLVAFGKGADLPELREADWSDVAGAIEDINPLIAEAFAMIQEGLPEEELRPLSIEIAKINQRLVKFYLEVIDKLPTNAIANGEYTHPLCLANAAAAVLADSELDLSEAQQAQVQRLGEQFERDWASREASYGPDTPAVTKIVDELKLKHQFMSGMRGELTADQRASLGDPSIQDRVRLDVLAPVLMTATPSGFPPALTGSTVDELRDSYVGMVASRYGIDRAMLDGYDQIWDGWVRSVQPGLQAVPAAEAPFYTTGQAVTAGEAHAQVLQQLLASGDLTEKQRQMLLDQPLFPVPRLVTP
jgi:hypothetical protein